MNFNIITDLKGNLAYLIILKVKMRTKIKERKVLGGFSFLPNRVQS